ncbi:acyl carrier protein [Jatrophihabitans sp.]|uniref:acyl carrier protein n=1 Tax=Jatrophihabitans sp. TaxID=1932789 RepID=UPI0030C781FF|nr:Phosphopantetheine attachment site [Jatrophihabitans sp.]
MTTITELMSAPLANELLALVSDLAEIDATAVDPQAPLAEVGIDSLMTIEIAVHVEQRFGARFTEDDLGRLHCLLDLVTLTQLQLART